MDTMSQFLPVRGVRAKFSCGNSDTIGDTIGPVEMNLKLKVHPKWVT